MIAFIDRMLGRSNKDGNSASMAKERLRFVLVHDRINLPPERLKEMKEEILAVISKYVAVANEDFDIALEQRDRNMNTIVAEIPFSKSLDLELIDDEDFNQQETRPVGSFEIQLDMTEATETITDGQINSDNSDDPDKDR